MISPLTMLVVLATTLTIASPLPEPKSASSSTSSVTTTDKRPVTTSSTSAPKKTGPVAHGLVKTGFEKMVDLNCIGKVDSNGDGDKASVSKKAVQVAFNGLAQDLHLDKSVKPQNKAGKTFPRKFDVNGAGTDVKALFSKDCPQRKQVNATFYQFPVGSTEAVFAGGETTQDRVLAFAHGKWPDFSKVAFCGVMTHRGQNAKVYTTCQKKQGPIEE